MGETWEKTEAVLGVICTFNGNKETDGKRKSHLCGWLWLNYVKNEWISTTAVHIDGDIIKKGCQRSEGGNNIGISGGAKGALGIGMGFGGGDAMVVEPYECAVGGIDFYGKCDDGEKCCDGKECDAYQKQLWEALHEKYAGEKYPGDELVGEVHHWNECGTEREPCVGCGVLDGVATFMGGYGCGCHGGSVIDVMAEVERAVDWVVVIGKGSVHFADCYVMDVVVVKHFLRHLTAGEISGSGDFRVFIEFPFYILADNDAEDCECDENNPDRHNCFLRF